MQEIERSVEVPFQLAGVRLDVGASQLFPEFSRSRIQSWIKSGAMTLNGNSVQIKTKLFGGERIDLKAQMEKEASWQPQAIALEVVHEDAEILVINKPVGLVVHPAAGHADGTILNALIHHAPDIAALPRAGIVHRLDKDTSGLMVVAKTLNAHRSLVEQLQDRSMGREYEAVVNGLVLKDGRVDAPIGRHPMQRKKMAVVAKGKAAVTHYRVLERFQTCTHLRLKLETGRTHQIRVHMAHIKHPIVGDPLYAGRQRQGKHSPAIAQVLGAFARQALHAKRLMLEHPKSGASLAWETELPEDMQQLLAQLARDAQSGAADA